MKKNMLLLLLTTILCLNASAQTINQYLNGIWKMECCDPDFIIIYENKIFWINEKNYKNVKDPILNYCIPKTVTYTEDDNFHKTFKKAISIDSVDFDRPFKLNDTGMELVYLLEYNKENIINNQAIKITDVGISLNYHYINPKEINRYYVWDGGAPSKIVYYNRILNPPKYLLDFYKKVASDRFKEIKSSKSIIYNPTNKPSKMYLVKGNEVEVLEQKDKWYKIRYYGIKTVEGWIKKEDVNNN